MATSQAELEVAEAQTTEAGLVESSKKTQSKPEFKLPTLQTRIRLHDLIDGTTRDEHGEVIDARFYVREEVEVNLGSSYIPRRQQYHSARSSLASSPSRPEPICTQLNRQEYLEFRQQVQDAILACTEGLYKDDFVLEATFRPFRDHEDCRGEPNSGLDHRICLRIIWWPIDELLESNAAQHIETHCTLIKQALSVLYRQFMKERQTLHVIR